MYSVSLLLTLVVVLAGVAGGQAEAAWGLGSSRD